MEDTDTDALLAELLGSADTMFANGDFVASERAYKSVLSMVKSFTHTDSLEQRYCLGRIADSAMQLEKYADCVRTYQQLLVEQLKSAPLTPDTLGVLLKLLNAMRLAVGINTKMVVASVGVVLLIGTAVVGASMWIPGLTKSSPTAKAAKKAPAAKADATTKAKTTSTTKTKARKGKRKHK